MKNMQLIQKTRSEGERAMKIFIREHRRLRFFAGVATAVVLLAWGRQGMAQSILDPCWGPAGVQSLNLGTITVPASLPVGGIIAERTATPLVNGNIAAGPSRYCYTQGATATLFTSAYDAANRIYNTNIPGVGIGIVVIANNVDLPSVHRLGVRIPFVAEIFHPGGTLTRYNAANYGVFLVKTAATVGSGALRTGLASTFTAGNGVAMYSLNITGGTIVAGTPTCSLSTSSATFNMGTVLTTAFTGGAGSRQPWVANQSLVSGGCNASTVSMTFAGTAAAAPYSNAFANAGTATGVALELWQANGKQAIPNSSTAIDFAPQGSGGRYTFSARYIQTAATVTPGSVNATVTVTVNYR